MGLTGGQGAVTLNLTRRREGVGLMGGRGAVSLSLTRRQTRGASGEEASG